jgi:hypothetical protein
MSKEPEIIFGARSSSSSPEFRNRFRHSPTSKFKIYVKPNLTEITGHLHLQDPILGEDHHPFSGKEIYLSFDELPLVGDLQISEGKI